MDSATRLRDALDFTARYAGYMFGSGIHTSRVLCCTERIAGALGMEVNLSMTFRHFVATVRDPQTGDLLTRVVSVPPLPISFERNADLSALSWQACDEHLSLDEINSRFERLTARPRIDPIFVLVLVGLANACFCRLFGGDLTAMSIVFTSTLAGFALRQRLMALHVNHYLVFVASSFLASICASLALRFDCTAQIAIASSPLFLIPGVPLINGIIDVVDGHVLVGFSRLVNALLLVLCIAIGLSATLLLVRSSLL